MSLVYCVLSYFGMMIVVIGIILGYKETILAKEASGVILICACWPFLALFGFGYWVGRFFEKLDKIL